MIILAIGAAALLAALYGLSSGTERGGPRAWLALLVAGLPLVALIGSGPELDRYRFSLLALRYRVHDALGVRPDTLVVSGNADQADLHVPGAGERPVAVLTPEGTSAVERVVAHPRTDAMGLLLVEEERVLGRDVYHALGGLPLEDGDTIEVGAPGAGFRLLVLVGPDSLAGLPVPWTRVHTLRTLGGAEPWLDDPVNGSIDARVAISPPDGWRRFLATRRPGILERSYPLADILDQVAPEGPGSRPGLSSFLFYDDHGRLSIALLDSEVRVGSRRPPPLPIWTAERGGRRVLVVGQPHRDYPEPDLTLPERYGVRPLRSVRFRLEGEWLEARPSRPEVHALDRAALEELDIRGPDGAGDEFRIRVNPGRGTLLRQAVVFATPPDAFGTAGQAVFHLPRNPARSDFEVVTPSGFSRWRNHHPLSLGDGVRSVLLRVDGQSASLGTLFAYGILLAVGVSVFWIWRLTGRLYALAVVLLGLAGVRLLLGLSAHAEPPFDQEAQQLALWVAPFLPWLVVVGSDIGAALREKGSRGVSSAHGIVANAGRSGEPVSTRWGWHAAFVVVLAALAWVLFADSLAKRLVLAILPAMLLGVLFVVRDRPRSLVRTVDRGSRLVRATGTPPSVRGALLGPGIRLGGLLLGIRLVMALLGAREQVVVFGTRLGVSVLYTPVALALLGWILWCGGRRLAAASGRDADREGAWVLVNVGMFVLLAFAGVSLAISDYGIVFTTLPGALVLLLVVGWPWAARMARPRVAAGVLAAPLVLFMAVQLAPSILHPWGATDARRLDGRMAEWSRNELLLLEREDPEALRLIGQRRSESLAVMRETMRSYTRGNWAGKGFMQGRVSEEVRPTATREHVPSALLSAQWGLAGAVGLLLLLGGFLLPLRGSRRPPDVGAARGSRRSPWSMVAAAAGFLVVVATLPRPFGVIAVLLLILGLPIVLLPVLHARSVPDAGTAPAPAEPPTFPGLLAGLFLATLAFSGVYMVLANYGWVLFTGKNVYLLGLDSVSDLLESTLLVAGAAAALSFRNVPSNVAARPALRRPVRAS